MFSSVSVIVTNYENNLKLIVKDGKVYKNAL